MCPQAQLKLQMREAGSPLDVLFCISSHYCQALYRLQEAGVEPVVPCSIFSALGKPHFQGHGILGVHVPLAVCILPSCWKCFHHTDLVPKMQPGQVQPPQVDLFSPKETSNPVSPPHSSLHRVLNPKKFGYVCLFMVENKTCDLKEILFFLKQGGPCWQHTSYKLGSTILNLNDEDYSHV